jgi:hypothetical protein
MEQLLFFTEPQSIGYAELEGLIDAKLDADFLGEIAAVFDSLKDRDAANANADANAA